jgi:hypothetical protein
MGETITDIQIDPTTGKADMKQELYKMWSINSETVYKCDAYSSFYKMYEDFGYNEDETFDKTLEVVNEIEREGFAEVLAGTKEQCEKVSIFLKAKGIPYKIEKKNCYQSHEIAKTSEIIFNGIV